MDATLEHVIVNVSDPKVSFLFYKNLFGYFDYKIFSEGEDYIAFRKKGTPDFWFTATEAKHIPNGFHRKNTGINHFAFHVSSREEIDRLYEEFLQPRGIAVLYGGPKLYPKYTKDYYAVYFEDPDRIKWEVASFSIKY